MSDPKNLLADETSPYLLQHANNPVAWHPWGEEALARARDEDRPILLSIGYAACHWCHVMERECFENEAIARLMNESFVCIKVDREERPDLDEIYMAATVAMSGSGGWPMTVFLTPDQKPFFAGTYFPPDDRHGRPGFPTLLTKIAEMWVSDRRSLLGQADELTAYVRAHAAVSQPAAISREATDAAVAQLASSFDPRWGGFGSAPKFPPCSALMLLLTSYQRGRDANTLRLVTKTLDGMKNGGMYDHVAGGFCRYSTDERWLVPHFEKMLYDNAQLSRVYLAAWQVTQDPEYRRVARETLDYVIREMQAPDGGFYCATDADSEGEEGKFFVWHPDELVAVLGPDVADGFCAFYDITPAGNWEGKSIPNTPRQLTEVAQDLDRDPNALLAELTEAKRLVYEARRQRPQPLLDDKLLGAWNGLMLGAMAEGFRVLRDQRYLDSATRAAVALQNTLLREDGRLFRTARAGRAHKDAVLEDYAYLADGLLDLYEAGGDDAWLGLAATLAERALRDFSDEESGAFHHTAVDHEPLIARMREGHDGALPNASAVLARALLRLGRQLARPEWVARAERTLAAYGREIQRIPRAFCTALGVAECLFEPAVELVIRGEGTDPAREALLTTIATHYLPNRVIAYASTDPAASSDERPLLKGKTTDGRAALFVCRNYTCLAPVYEASAVAEALAANEQTRTADRSHRIGDFRIPGRATKEGTARYAARFAEARFASLAGLTVSLLGFGGYRVDDETPEHRAALTSALMAGVNLIDTSTNYSDGQSERLVGQVLGSLIGGKQLLREEVVVVSKMGYVQGANLDRVNERKAVQNPYPDVVELGPGLRHCIHPDWLAEQLEESLSRLGLEHLDVCLLHNPEYFLTHAAKEGRRSLTEARDEFYRRVTQAFAFFETAMKDGRIGCYGVSSNTVTAAQDDREATDLARILDAARRAGGETHGFRVVQLPLNLMETGAVFEKNTQGGAHCALSFAKEHDLAVLVNRPLNAITPSGLCRLADPPVLAGTPPVETQLGKVAALEQQFRSDFAPSIRTGPDGPAPETLLDWASQLAQLPAQVRNLAAWSDLEAQVIAPRTKHVLNALTGAMGGAAQPQFAEFRQRYEEELQTLCVALAARAAQVSRSEAQDATRLVDPLLPTAKRQAPLSQKALAVLLGTAGVSSVLVGMRRPEYVTDAVAVTTWPATSGLEALRSR